ncbi:MAG: aminotransferase class III-fold pyridoxal phosphate-dependent enzyme [Anaerolineales bacterium]|nr:aminotransferase class III-fold pyridoxal phosphate-dependent enzyme [Anaerolineales bacterium]
MASRSLRSFLSRVRAIAPQSTPQEGFLQLIRKRTEEYGCVFILDEVKTGFRIANGGAQEYYSIKPDLVTYAKALGNGYPIAAFGGGKEIMSIIGHGVAQGGTYTNNKPGVAGAYATLNLLKSKPILKTIEKRGQRLMDGLKEIFEENDIPAVFTGYPAMFSFSLNTEAVTCQRDWQQSDRELYLTLTERRSKKVSCPTLMLVNRGSCVTNTPMPTLTRR